MVHHISAARLIVSPLALAPVLTMPTLAAQAEVVSVATIDGSPAA